MRIDLSADTGVARYLGNGWAAPEPGYIWAMGPESWILVEAATVTRAIYFSFRAWPHLRPGRLPAQRLAIAANGHHIADFAFRGPQMVAGLIEADIAGNKAALCLRLSHPDNARPKDFPDARNPDDRPLALAYEEIVIEELEEDETTLLAALNSALSRPPAPPPPHAAAADPKILQDFQSAGDDCEFGFIQREHGVQAISLLRFASIRIDDLSRGLRTGFNGIAAPNRMQVFVPENAPGHDYLGREGNYGLMYHTGIQPDAIEASTLKAKEIVRLRRLAEKFIEDAELAEHIFVVKYKAPPLPVQLARLLAAFRRRGPVTLLWVREATAGRAPGTAEYLLSGLIAGYVDRIDTAPLTNISTRSWLTMCAAAHALWMAHRV
jgi:hypothetical protein